MNRTRLAVLLFGVLVILLARDALSRQPPAGAAQGRPDPLAEPFKGVTTDGSVQPGLFSIKATGVSTARVQKAATSFLASLTDEQRKKTMYPVDDAEWRRWNNVHRYARQGTSFREMTADQRERAFDLLAAGLSAEGLTESRNIMRLNGYLAEVKNNPQEYGEDLYFLTVMGEPSPAKPWGWQLDGHHLIVNYFVLRDQVVMTPTFMGSEPVLVTTGKYAGTKVLGEEETKGLALMNALTPSQQKTATLDTAKPQNNALAQAFRDNLTLAYAGIRASELDARQQKLLLDVVAEYVDNMDSGHAKIRMDEVRKHLADTWFAWIGEHGAESVFYYRVHSPVILIEFDHQLPVALEGPRVPNKHHVHTVVRTPNGNDYGKDLLRQHYESQRSNAAHGHPQY